VEELVPWLVRVSGARIREVLLAVDEVVHYDVQVDVLQLSNDLPCHGYALLSSPKRAIPLVEEALQVAQELIRDDDREQGLVMTAKRFVHPRVCCLPKESLFSKPNISSLRSVDVGTLIALPGTVTRVGATLVREVEKKFVCVKCQYEFVSTADITRRGSFLLPPRCPSDLDKPCYSTSYTPSSLAPTCRDYQEIKLQEKISHLAVGSIPRSIVVAVQDNLVGRCKAGDDVIVSGVLLRRWNRNPAPEMRCSIELMIEALHVEHHNERKSFVHIDPESEARFNQFWEKHRDNPLRARNLIVSSICPQIFGLFAVKLILVMSLVGGTSRRDTNGMRVRGQSHLLMVGEPGTAKSQLLRYAARLIPRSVLTTGVGTTSAGEMVFPLFRLPV